ncbi:hypothetical protein [Belnapia rosea]|uniref:hypothetical protein n=1 Tax=Belnapia rosea TaxID=938405 RepID=UPI00115FCB8E|nr:hypothetical protein [Belnapia rosea]
MAQTGDQDEERQRLEAELANADLSASSGARSASAFTQYVRDHYDTLAALKSDNGLSWSQMAVLLGRRGLRADNGTDLTGPLVNATMTRERWRRDPKSRKVRNPAPRKYRRGSTLLTELPSETPAPLATASEPTPAPTAPAQAAGSSVTGGPTRSANPYAEFDQQVAENREKEAAKKKSRQTIEDKFAAIHKLENPPEGKD